MTGPDHMKMTFHPKLNLFIAVLILFCLMTTDDSWLNLTNQDLEDMLSKYSDPNSRETGELAGENAAKSIVSTYKSARLQ